MTFATTALRMALNDIESPSNSTVDSVVAPLDSASIVAACPSEHHPVGHGHHHHRHGTTYHQVQVNSGATRYGPPRAYDQGNVPPPIEALDGDVYSRAATTPSQHSHDHDHLLHPAGTARLVHSIIDAGHSHSASHAHQDAESGSHVHAHSRDHLHHHHRHQPHVHAHIHCPHHPPPSPNPQQPRRPETPHQREERHKKEAAFYKLDFVTFEKIRRADMGFLHRSRDRFEDGLVRLSHADDDKLARQQSPTPAQLQSQLSSFALYIRLYLKYERRHLHQLRNIAPSNSRSCTKHVKRKDDCRCVHRIQTAGKMEAHRRAKEMGIKMLDSMREKFDKTMRVMLTQGEDGA